MFSFLDEPDAATGGVGLAFSDRAGGVTPGVMGTLNLGRGDVDDVDNLRENFERVGAALSIGTFATVRQMHSADVVTVDRSWLSGWSSTSHLGSSVEGQGPLPVADALVTATPGVALTIRVADCLPVLLADRTAKVIAAAHAGRVGLFAGVLANTVSAMRALGARTISATIGPHVCGACYEVPADMVAALAPTLPAVRSTTTWGTPALDLAAGARSQLESLGCMVEQVGGCTRTETSLHSYRRDGARSGRLAGLVWLA